MLIKNKKSHITCIFTVWVIWVLLGYLTFYQLEVFAKKNANLTKYGVVYHLFCFFLKQKINSKGGEKSKKKRRKLRENNKKDKIVF